MTFLEQASQLPATEKLRLIEQLIAELDLPDPTIEALWAEEAVRRSQAVKDGAMTTRPLADVLQKYEA